jgi:CHAT domain-containing protein
LRRLVLLVIVLAATACTKEDTVKSHLRRAVAPRLSISTQWAPCRTQTAPDRVIQQTQCGEEPALSERRECPESLKTAADATQLLAEHPFCIAPALAALEREAASRATASTKSDLAAAYYVRAQRDDRASDVLRALVWADDAVSADPHLPAARFNRALAEEAVGLRDDARADWTVLAESDDAQWATEAAAHRDALARRIDDAAARRWDAARQQVMPLLVRGDRDAVAALIEPFPWTAEQFLLDDLLPQWANDPTAERLRVATLLAEEISRRTRDSHTAEIAHVIADAPPARREILRKAHLAFLDARLAQKASGDDAAAKYETASELLHRGGSPLELVATMRLTNYDPSCVNLLFAEIERPVRERHYTALGADIRAVRGFDIGFKARYVEALTEYDAAFDEYKRIDEKERFAKSYASRAGLYRELGDDERAAREALLGMSNAPDAVDPQDRHAILGESSAAARALGLPRAALFFANRAVRSLQHDLDATSADRVPQIRYLQRNLGIALRERATVEIELANADAAARDLDQSTFLVGTRNVRDLQTQHGLQARVDEVRGLALLHKNPNAAIAAFTQALQYPNLETRGTAIALLHARRAAAERAAGRSADAERDLVAALQALHEEETRILEERQLGAREVVWSRYFARFRDTYESLIGQLVDEQKIELAFKYAERSRAYEPLNLIGRLAAAPQSFRDLTHLGEPLDVSHVQRALPAGTFLLQYLVLKDRTLTWVVSHDGLVLVRQRATEAQVRRWNDELLHAAQQGNAAAFDRGLLAPYGELLAEPLAVIAKHGGTENSRIVIVPDSSMQGLPFAALQDANTRRHLVEDATVSIAGSATLYIFSLLRDRQLPRSGAPSALLVGDPAFDTNLPLPKPLERLPGAAHEVKEIGALYGSRAVVLTGTAATVPAFFALARDKNIVHVAGHAIANAERPSRSLLLLAPSPNDTGALYADQLLEHIQLDHTRLVVLATCSSAGGTPVGPEGVAPLVRPLIAAGGVPAVVGSLWDVNDATAETLLVSFHRHYGRGEDAATALRNAQLDMLANTNPGRNSALAWAPFELIGHASSPFAATAQH